MQPISHHRQLKENIQRLLNGAPLADIGGPLPNETAIVDILLSSKVIWNCVCLDSPGMIDRAKADQAISINSLDPCLGLIAFDRKNKVAYASHTTMEGEFALDVLLDMVPVNSLAELSIVSVGQNVTGRVGTFTKAIGIEVGKTRCIPESKFFFRDQYNHAPYRALRGMDALVVPAYRTVFIFGEQPGTDEPRLLDVIHSP